MLVLVHLVFFSIFFLPFFIFLLLLLSELKEGPGVGEELQETSAGASGASMSSLWSFSNVEVEKSLLHKKQVFYGSTTEFVGKLRIKRINTNVHIY